MPVGNSRPLLQPRQDWRSLDVRGLLPHVLPALPWPDPIGLHP